MKNNRIHLLNELDRYIIVLEERDNYILLITSFYISEEHTLIKKLKTTIDIFHLFKSKNRKPRRYPKSETPYTTWYMS